MAFEKESEFFNKLFWIGTKISEKWMESEFIGKGKKISQMFTTRNPLYHYTTVSGLLGIVESNCFWLTNLKYMNDLSEQKFAYNIVKKALDEIRSNNFYSPNFRQILDCACSLEVSKEDYYAVCFTDDGDSLPMWSLYGKECGIAIEIDLNSDFNFVFGPNCFFEDMIYDEKRLYDFVSIVVGLYYELYKEYENDTSIKFNIINNDISREIMLGTLRYVNNFKNPGFSYESETRLLYRWKQGEEIHRRIKNNLIVSYVEMPPKDLNGDKLLPIKSVKIGPGEEQELIRQSVEDFMKAKGYALEVKKSDIPYRAR